MNFLAHYVIATRFLTPAEPISAYVVGTALPDLLPMAAERVRLRPAHIAQTAARAEFETALRAGVSAHLATDAAFHKTSAFAQAQAEVSQILAETPFKGLRVRRFFAAHILTELALDAVLLRADTSLADNFYAAFAAADFAAVTRWAEAITGRPLPNLTAALMRFAGAEYLRQYASDDGVAFGLSQICGRARQDTFEGENFVRLVSVVKQAAALLPKYVPALLSETGAGIFLPKQEETHTASKAASI